MKAITVQQPWAGVIASGDKTVENRTWGTKYRGPLAIHAGARWSGRGAQDPRVAAWANHRGFTYDGFRAMPAGFVLATAELEDCHPDTGCCKPWGESSYRDAAGALVTEVWHWVLADIERLPDLAPAKGRLGLWEWTP